MTALFQDEMERALAMVRELGCGLRPQRNGSIFDEDDDRDRHFRDAFNLATDLAQSGVPEEEAFLVRRLRESYAAAQRTPSEDVVCQVLVIALGDRGSVVACPIMCRMLVDGFGSEGLRQRSSRRFTRNTFAGASSGAPPRDPRSIRQHVRLRHPCPC